MHHVRALGIACLIVFGVALVGAVDQRPSLQYIPLPPTDLRGPATTKVTFMSTQNVTKLCGAFAADKETPMRACAMGDAIIMPEPCEYTGQSFARIMCHEKGHVLGWTHD